MLTISELQLRNIVDYHGYPAIVHEKSPMGVKLGGLGQFNIDPGDYTLIENIGPFFPEDDDYEHLGFTKLNYANGDYSYQHKVTGHIVYLMVDGKPIPTPLHEIQNEICTRYKERLPIEEIFYRRKPNLSK